MIEPEHHSSDAAPVPLAWGEVPTLPDEPPDVHWLQYGGEMGVARLTPCLKLVGMIPISADPDLVTCKVCQRWLPGAPEVEAQPAEPPARKRGRRREADQVPVSP